MTHIMTDTTDQQAVAVAQEDIDLAESIIAIEFDNSHAAYRDNVAAIIARHRLASLSLGNAEDFVLVPREPTAEMMEAGRRPERGDPLCNPGMCYLTSEVTRIYRAMLAANKLTKVQPR